MTSPLSILLIDDHPASRRFLAARLAALGAVIRLADSGQEGIAALKKDRFDLVLAKLSRAERDKAPLVSRLGSDTTVVSLQPESGRAEDFDLTLATSGEIRYFFSSLRYLAGAPPAGDGGQPPGSPS